MAPNGWQAIIWTNADLIHWRIYAMLGGDELNLIRKEQDKAYFFISFFFKRDRNKEREIYGRQVYFERHKIRYEWNM